MSYVYMRTEPSLFTVGHYDPSGTWHPDNDYGSRDAAAARVHWLNGGNTTSPAGEDEEYEDEFAHHDEDCLAAIIQAILNIGPPGTAAGTAAEADLAEYIVDALAAGELGSFDEGRYDKAVSELVAVFQADTSTRTMSPDDLASLVKVTLNHGGYI